LNGFYMYGHANSNTDGINTIPANPYSPQSMAGEYGPSSLDIHHRAFLGGTITTIGRIQLAPFLLMNSGAPFNITTGTDPYGTTILTTARPAIASGPGSGIIHYDGLYLDPNPQPGEPILGRNFGRGPGSVNFNLRVARTWGFGASREDTANRPRGAGGGGGRPGGGPRGAPGGFGGRAGGGPGFAGGGGGSTSKRYNLTLALQGHNVLNHVNPGPVNGIITSPLFGQSNSVAGGQGAFAESANNRRMEWQLRFAF